LESVVTVGQKNQVEIFLTALERCVRSLSLYSYSSGQSTVDNVFENTINALDRCFAENDEVELTVKPFEIVFERKAVYSNKEKKTSLSFLLYESGIRLLILKRGLTRDELNRLVQIISTDFTKQENMDDDIYCLLLEQDSPHFRAVGADLLRERMEKDPGFREELKVFSMKASSKSAEIVSNPVRKLRSEDLRILEDFRLNPAQFSRPDADVQKLIHALTSDRGSARGERQTLERLLLMGFHFLINDKDGEQARVGRDLVGRITLMSLQAQLFDLFEAVIQKLVSLQKTHPDRVGDYQKILDGIYHVDHLHRFEDVLKGGGEEKLVKLLSIGPSSAVKVIISLLGHHPKLGGLLQEFIFRHTPMHLNWLLEAVAKNPQAPQWEALLGILSQRPSVVYQKLLQLMMDGCGPAVRLKIIRFLGDAGGEESLKVFAQILASDREDERGFVYELLSKIPHRSALTTLRAHLDSPRFATLSLQEREQAYASVVQMGGELSFPYFLELWNEPASGLFRKRVESERQGLILRAMISSRHPRAHEFASQIDSKNLDSSVKDLLEALIKQSSKRGNP